MVLNISNHMKIIIIILVYNFKYKVYNLLDNFNNYDKPTYVNIKYVHVINFN